MATKAVHIEVVSSLTSEAFIAALKRFVARRGLCSDIYSDCGSNFVGGKAILDNDLKKAITSWTEDTKTYLTSHSIKWHFNPPASPHFGGIWEAGVKSIKFHLRRTLGNLICTYEEYATVLTQIESCLNSRPLCYINNNPEDILILTPGHFVIGDALNAIPEPNYDDVKIPAGLRWKLLQQRVHHFWNKWSKDYLNQLQNKPKWHNKEDNIKVGDVVLLKSENFPPTAWPLARVEEVHPGADGLVRVVQVRTKNSTFKRPISKLCRLPMDESTTPQDNQKTKGIQV